MAPALGGIMHWQACFDVLSDLGILAGNLISIGVLAVLLTASTRLFVRFIWATILPEAVSNSKASAFLLSC